MTGAGYRQLAFVITVGFFLLIATACGGSGCEGIFCDTTDADMRQEWLEGQEEVELYDRYLDEKYDRLAGTAMREIEMEEGEKSSFSSSSGCPTGCQFYQAGCAIKGNISINTGEKIYHVPGGEFYNATKINPKYGERWFCTEAEAIANGWRRSKQ